MKQKRENFLDIIVCLGFCSLILSIIIGNLGSDMGRGLLLILGAVLLAWGWGGQVRKR